MLRSRDNSGPKMSIRNPQTSGGQECSTGVACPPLSAQIRVRVGAAVGLAVWCFAVVSTVDNLLRPWLVGKDTKMPDILVLLGTLGGLAMFGAVGIIIGPVLAALFVTAWELFGSAVDELEKSPERAESEAAS